MKNAIRTCAPDYSMRRMLVDYVNKLYVPAMISGAVFAEKSFDLAREMNAWKNGIRQRWGSTHVEARVSGNGQLTVGEAVPVSARVWLNGIPEASVAVEAVLGTLDSKGALLDPQVVTLHPAGRENDALLFNGEIRPEDSGRFALGVRLRPQHEKMVNPYEMGLTRWA